MNYDLLIAFLNVQEPNRLRRGVPNDHWLKLFRYYNENSGEKRLGMSCSPCFEKVYWYCKVVLGQMAGIEHENKMAEAKEKANEFRANNIV